MTSGVDLAETETDEGEYHTTDMPCVVCLTTLSLDDDQPRLGKVRWQLRPYFGLRRGKPVAFSCPQGHSSDADPELPKAFPPRTF